MIYIICKNLGAYTVNVEIVAFGKEVQILQKQRSTMKTRSISCAGLKIILLNCADPLKWSENRLRYESACSKVEGSWGFLRQPFSGL